MMKNKFLFLVLLGFVMLSSCSDDDKALFDNYSESYSADKLDLTFNGKKLTDKSVSVNSLNKENVSLALKNMIPGEDSLVIANLAVLELGNDDFSFVGENKNNDRTISVEGAVKSNVLTLSTNFKVTSKVVGKWQMLPVELDEEFNVLASGVYVNIVPESDTSTIMGEPVAMMVALIENLGGQILPTVLTEIDLKDDGNVIATYMSNFSDVMGGTEGVVPIYVLSPEGVATYNVKNGELYLAMDVASLMSRSDMNMVNVLNMLVKGLPMKMVTDNGIMRVYVDKQMMVPFMGLLEDLVIPMMQGNDDLKDFMPIVQDVIRLVRTAKTVEIGLNLVPAVKEELVSANIARVNLKELLHKFVK